MNEYWLFVIIIGYLVLLFLIAYGTEATLFGRRIADHPMTYSLSLAVYCSAWTYYGSVGLAARSGVGFLTTYLGPLIAMPLWVTLQSRIITITKRHKLSTLADFISLRYGKSRFIGALVTLVCLVSVIPYIALQLKAVSETFQILSFGGTEAFGGKATGISTFFIAFVLALFAAFFGTQVSDASERRRGIVTAVAFESILKLVFFLLIGAVVTFVWFDGTADLFTKASSLPNFRETLTLDNSGQSSNWGYSIALSFLAIFLLPRQFQVGVIENLSRKHLKTAVWSFPLYLLLFNVFVVFIAWAGRLELGDLVDADHYALLLPLHHDNYFLAVLVFLGGFSASISMVVVSSLALATMVSNNLIIPYGYLGRFASGDPKGNARMIKIIRRTAIFLSVIAAYFFFDQFNVRVSLATIGRIAFVMIAQLAPAFFIGLFWNRGSSKGAIAGMLLGLLTVLYTLIIPFLQEAFFQSSALVDNGLFGIELLRPQALFGIDTLSPINHAFLWSMVVNVGAYVLVSLSNVASYRERNYAEMVVNESSYGQLDDQALVWRGEAYVSDIRTVLTRFLGEKRTARAMDIFYRKYDVPVDKKEADSRLVLFAEKLLAGRIGSASARILIANVTKEQALELHDVLEILEESKQTMASKLELEDRSRKLQRLTAELSAANQALIEQDKQKDDFLGTVSHELKTPITSIKAASEVLESDSDMPAELREQFIGNILNDAERLSILIHNILDFEKLDSGRADLNIAEHDISVTVEEAKRGVEQLAKKNGVAISLESSSTVMLRFDEDRILQVLTNVLSNAMKFVPKEDGKIRISLEEKEEQIAIAIADNGKGIPAEDASFVFERFYQSKDQNRRKPQGSGLGLAICKKIMERHAGDIRLDSDYTKGAKFIISLPK